MLVDHPRMEIGVDGHLPARQAIEREPCGDFADSGRSLSDHHELDHDQDREQDHPDDHLVARHERTEGPDDLTRRIQPVLAAAGQDNRAVATFSTSRVRVVVSRIVGNAA